MAFLLRKIRKNRWYKTEKIDWLPSGELPADPLNDLGTKSNELSVFHVSADESNLNRILASLATNVEQLSHVDFALFDEELISELGIKIKKSKGDLPDEQVNNWHSDLFELSATKLLLLAKAISNNAKFDRKLHTQILELIADMISSGQIDRSRIKWKSLDDFEKLDKLLTERAKKHHSK